jgi:hypothetical protein
MLLLEIKHDKENVEKLIKFNRRSIEDAQEWIRIKSNRTERRIGVFFGNSDKIALLSLASFGWSVWKYLSEKSIEIKLSLTGGDPTQNLLVWITALLTGIAIRAVFAKMQLRKYTYHLELIELTLKRKSENKKYLFKRRR